MEADRSLLAVEDHDAGGLREALRRFDGRGSPLRAAVGDDERERAAVGVLAGLRPDQPLGLGEALGERGGAAGGERLERVRRSFDAAGGREDELRAGASRATARC